MSANPAPKDYAQQALAYRKNQKTRQEAIEAQLSANSHKAQANHDYRKAIAAAYTKHRGQGKGQGEAEILARADAAHFELQRDMADADAKRCNAEVELYKDERATLRHLADMAQEQGA